MVTLCKYRHTLSMWHSVVLVQDRPLLEWLYFHTLVRFLVLRPFVGSLWSSAL